MISETIILNGKEYNKENLIDLKFENESINSWQNNIYSFLKDWFDDSEVIITRTSGSTGKPKEIKLSKTAMRNSAQMTNTFFGLDATKKALLCLPATYIAGKMMMVRAIISGFNLLSVEPKANPFENLSEKIDFTAITPYQLNYASETLKSYPVKNIIVGGGHVNSLMEKLAENIPARMYETYGMTETASHIALRCFNGSAKSDYFTVLGDVLIRQDERDCLVIFAPHLHNEELITNDIVEMKDARTFRWLGRADMVINSGGVKVFPEQVEKKLERLINSHFFIAGQADDVLGEKVILVIESLDLLADSSQLEKEMKLRLEKYEIPKRIFYTPGFVYSSSNKILRKETLKRFLQH